MENKTFKVELQEVYDGLKEEYGKINTDYDTCESEVLVKLNEGRDELFSALEEVLESGDMMEKLNDVIIRVGTIQTVIFTWCNLLEGSAMFAVTDSSDDETFDENKKIAEGMDENQRDFNISVIALLIKCTSIVNVMTG